MLQHWGGGGGGGDLAYYTGIYDPWLKSRYIPLYKTLCKALNTLYYLNGAR